MDVTIAPVRAGDLDAFVAAAVASHDLHHPWINPPDRPDRFEEWIEHLRRDDQEAFLIRHRASLALVGRLGFEREGYSPAYLMVDSQWRDHERWAIRSEIWARRRARPGGGPE